MSVPRQQFPDVPNKFTLSLGLLFSYNQQDYLQYYSKQSSWSIMACLQKITFYKVFLHGHVPFTNPIAIDNSQVRCNCVNLQASCNVTEDATVINASIENNTKPTFQVQN